MFGLLAFFFKLFFSTFFSVLYSYFIIEEEKNNVAIILFAVLGTSIGSMTMQLSDVNFSISHGISIFVLIYFSNKIFKVENIDKKILFIFPSIIGLMIGFGLIFQSIILIVFIYLIKNNLNYIYDSKSLPSEINENNEKNDN